MMMRNFVAGHIASTDREALELAIGTPPDLWLGPETGETAEERAARLQAARDILADDPSLLTRVSLLAHRYSVLDAVLEVA